tara:strand:+ start:282 stop:515 length:234 start_codon:yes stop_codon:yes gene_type:complete
MKKISEYQKEKKKRRDRETLQKKRDAAKSLEETARLKAEKELQKIKSEKKRSPEVMWDQLLFNSGGQFEDVKFKKVL